MTLNLHYKIYTDLCTIYSATGRYYHNLEHISQCLVEFEDFVRLNPKEFILKREVECALWFHDVIYVPGSKNNEAASAKLFQQYAKNFDLSCDESLVEELILSTKEHTNDSSIEFKLVNDIDMSILGKDYSRCYGNYMINIEKEYKHIPTETYIKGRFNFLKAVLAYDRIYKTDYFFNKYEAQARKNLTQEKNSLISSFDSLLDL